MVKISIIMPVYNDELYLEEAIKSIIKQTLKDIEIICVNDGSTDNSLNILNKLKNKYDTIKVISQENQGVSVARNNAMDVATGDYLAFLDSDDIFMDKDALEKLYEVAVKKDANMVSGNLNIWNKDGSFTKFTFLKYYTKYETILPEDYGIPFSFTKAIFKRDFLINNKIYFPLLTKGEDPVFLAEVLSKLDYVYAVPVDVYAYRYIDGSVKYNSYRNYLDQVTHYKMVFDNMSDSKFDKHTHDFKYQLITLFDFMGKKRSKPTLKAIREVFANDSKILRQCEEYFYYKYRKNKKLKDLVELKKDPKHPRISVIIPIYNNENYIKSIKKILKQTLDDLEIICVNDGSTDNSLELLNNVAKKDSRIKIITQEHKGYASAKNKGLNIAKGDFIYFWDVTNPLPKKFLEEMYKNAIFNDSDIVLSKLTSPDYSYINFNSVKVDLKNKFKSKNFKRFTFNYHDIKEYVLNKSFLLNNKLYNRKFLEKFDDLEFELDVAFEDMLFHIKSILRASHISFEANVSYDNKFNLYSTYYQTAYNNTSVIYDVENFLKNNDYLSDFEEEFNLFKFTYLVNCMAYVNSEDVFQKVKNELIEMSFDEYYLAYKSILGRYINIMHSKSLYEFKINDCKNRMYNLEKYYEKLQKKQDSLIKNNQKLKKKYKKLKKTNKAILKSNSWKATKPIRNFKDSKKNS